MPSLISSHVDGGLSGWSRVYGPGSKDLHLRERNLIISLYLLNSLPRVIKLLIIIHYIS